MQGNRHDPCKTALRGARRAAERAAKEIRATNRQFEQILTDTLADLDEALKAFSPTPDDLVSRWRLDPAAIAGGMIKILEPGLRHVPRNHVATQIVTRMIVTTVETVKNDDVLFSKLQPAIAREMLGDLAWLREAVARIDENVQSLVGELSETNKRLGLQERLLIGVARQYGEDAVKDFDSALKAIKQALKLAAEARRLDALPSNLGDAVDPVLERKKILNDRNDLDGAQIVLEDRLRTMRGEEKERIAKQSAEYARLHERGILQARLRNHPDDAAKYALAGAEVEGRPDFEVLRIMQVDWYDRGRNTGLIL